MNDQQDIKRPDDKEFVKRLGIVIFLFSVFGLLRDAFPVLICLREANEYGLFFGDAPAWPG